MGKLGIYTVAWLIVILFLSCGSPDPNATQVSDFEDYASWKKVNSQSITGDQSGALGRAHEGAAGFREVYVNRVGEAGLAGAAEFPAGSIVVKESFNESGGQKGNLTGVTVMVKRSEGFDTDHGDWEYINATAGLKIRGQGSMRNCIDCHAKADTDYIFANY